MSQTAVSSYASIGTLGIDGLREVDQRLEAKSLYWINVDERETALAWALSLDLNANRSSRLVIHEADAHVLRELNSGEWKSSIAYQLSMACGQENALYDLAYGLAYWPLRGQTLVVVMSSEVVAALDEKRLAFVLKRLATEAESRDVGILVISYGHCSERVRQRLFEHQMVLRGFVDFVEGHYHLRFWRTKAMAVTDIQVKLRLTSLGWQMDSTPDGDFVAGDHQAVYTVESAWKREAQDQSLEMFPDNQSVFDKGMNSAAATLVFSVRDMNEATEVARLIHRLRTARGRYLKIAVREQAPMRAAVEALLLGCGANLVFQPEATFGYIRTMLTNLTGQCYVRDVHPNFDRVYEELMHVNNRGFIEAEDFFQQVKLIVTQRSDALTSRGALVILKPKSGIDAVETMMALKVARGGDIATVINGRVVLFLYGCQSSFLKTVLKRIFAVLPTELFESYVDIYDNEIIEDAIEALAKAKFEEKMTDRYHAMFSYARERSDLFHGHDCIRRLGDFVKTNPVIPTPVKGDK